MDIDTLATLFGWMAVINIAILSAATAAMIAMPDTIARLHARLFGLDPGQVRLTIYTWIGHYKMAVLVLVIAPYLALRLI